MSTNEYSLAFSEALDVLQHSEIDIIEKIPLEVIKILKEKSSKEYVSKINDIDNFDISRKAKAILAAIYKNYLCNEEEKEEFQAELLENEAKYQEEQRKKYNPDKIFKMKNNAIEENVQMVEYKESFIKRIINKIKRLIRI